LKLYKIYMRSLKYIYDEVKKCKIKEWEERLNKLKSRIKYWCDNKTEKMIHLEYLFYDS
jgi:hypothetical protein